MALVTGAREDRLPGRDPALRAGCRVIACTRFPRDAAARCAREPDFDAWKERLTIYGIDLRHTPSVELLCQRLDATLPRLDFQLHNACQTVRRPPGFYGHLLEREQGPARQLPEAERALVQDYDDLRAALPITGRRRAWTSPASLAGAERRRPPAREDRAELFPRGVLDQDLQQVDLRTHNSWRPSRCTRSRRWSCSRCCS